MMSSRYIDLGKAGVRLRAYSGGPQDALINAHRSSGATMHVENARTTHEKSGTHLAKGHSR